jgi:hypothetical protein
MENLLISLLGNRDSGKSTTWNELFGRNVRTGNEIRRLYLNSNEYVEVFLISGSPEERDKYVGDIVGEKSPRIILCSMQYRHDVISTIDYFLNNNYTIYCQWINPGYSDDSNFQMFDILGVYNYLASKLSTISIQSGKSNLNSRVQLIKEHIYGWAKYKDLIHSS